MKEEFNKAANKFYNKDYSKLTKVQKHKISMIVLFGFSDEIAEFVINNFKSFSKSPYSKSFYSTNNKTWNNTPENSYRLSDHWNFKTPDGELHCKTDKKLDHNFHICKYENGIYNFVI